MASRGPYTDDAVGGNGIRGQEFATRTSVMFVTAIVMAVRDGTYQKSLLRRYWTTTKHQRERVYPWNSHKAGGSCAAGRYRN